MKTAIEETHLFSVFLPPHEKAGSRQMPKSCSVQTEMYFSIFHPFHSNQAGNSTYHDESAISYGIQLAYYAAQKYYTTILEMDSGKGYADIAYLPGPCVHMPVLLIELKYNQTADTALKQIRRQQYPDRLALYKGNILLVGITYRRDLKNTDPKFKHHTCKIEHA